MEFGVLGPVVAWDDGGDRIDLRGPRHREVLARLIAARGRVVPVGRLAEDLWIEPPANAVGALRTFVGELRAALEPGRAPRTPARVLVTDGPGYALRAERVDAWRFEDAVAAALPADAALTRLDEALSWWRGPAYADFAGAHWAAVERSRLAELRLHAVERRAEARLALGLAAEAVPELDAHVAEHPWREEGWRLLALALYRSGRQGDALAVLRRARAQLVEQLGLDPGPALRSLETDILNHADHLDPGSLWAQATAAYDRTVAVGSRARLRSTVGLLRELAVTGGGGLLEARRHRVAAIAAAEELGDPELTARVIGAYDVPAIWTRSDDPAQAAAIVAAATRALRAGELHDAARARLLATIAVETRGSGTARAAAEEAEAIARRLDDPALLAFALNGVFMQRFERTGLAPERDALGAELVVLSARHGLTTYEVLGRLIRLQARCALADFAGADVHADAADALAARHELPLVGVFTEWYAALRLAVHGGDAEPAYRAAAARLDGAGMPGLQQGLLGLALFSIGVESDDLGPYEPWVAPLRARGPREAAAALRGAPDPPRDLLQEGLWALIARAARDAGDERRLERARAVLAPAAGELAGAASGLVSFGPVARFLA